jgi:hypothetical protein
MSRPNPHTRTAMGALALAFATLLAVAILAERGAAQGGGPEVTLRAQPGELNPGRSSTLRGTLSGVTTGADGREVTLLMSEYPYASEAVAGTTTTDADGDYEFTVTPELNTRYRVRFDGGVIDGTATSDPAKVFVFATGDARIRVLQRRGIVKSRWDLFYSPRVQPEYYVGRTVYWYFRKLSQPRLRIVERTKARDTARGFKAQAAWRLPPTRRGYRFEFFPCLPAPARDVGIGNDKPLRCPKNPRARMAGRLAAAR